MKNANFPRLPRMRCLALGSLLLGSVAFPTLTACRPGNAPAPAASQAAAKVVTLRGVIEVLPAAGAPRHVVIHNAPAREMSAMTMTYTADSSVPLADLAVGDKVAYDWNEDDEHITRIEKLPPDTALNFDATQPTP